MRDLIQFADVKKRGKHPWRNVTFIKVAGFATLLKVTLVHGCFSRFLNFTNDIKLRNASHMVVILALYCLD